MCPLCKQKYGTNATCTACQKHKAYEESLARSNWNKNSVQFPRLLAEIYAAGLTDEQYDTLEESMDLERDQSTSCSTAPSASLKAKRKASSRMTAIVRYRLPTTLNGRRISCAS